MIGETKYLSGKNSILSIVDVIRFNNIRYYLIECSICSTDKEIYDEKFKLSVSDWNKGVIPCGCSKHPIYTEEQAITIAKRRSESVGKEFYGFCGEYKGISKTKVYGSCPWHKNNSWGCLSNYLKKDSECSICSKRKPVFGIGINDSVTTVINGEKCPYYRTWYSMLRRCYSEEYHNRFPTYKNCVVDSDWLLFSNFKSWMEQQDWEGKHLDKDLLVEDNKVYSANTCLFLEPEINYFTLTHDNERGSYPIGVSLSKNKEKFVSYCSGEYLGCFTNQLSAHREWQKAKVRKAKILMEGQNENVKQGLSRIVDKILKDIRFGRETKSF